MNIELRRFVHHARLSQETNAFSADLYIDGKKVGEAHDDGQGGEVRIDVRPEFRDLLNRARDWAKAQPPVPTPYGDQQLPMDLEFYLSLQVEDLIRAKDAERQQKTYRRWCATDTVFRLKGDQPDAWRVHKHLPFTPIVAAKLRQQYGEMLETILNETI